VPTAITVLASDLHTAAGLPQFVRVAETGTGANGTDFTFNAAPGIYHLAAGIGDPYGSFTVATDGTISGTTGALVASGSTIDFDLTKLAAVTIYGGDLKTASGWQQSVNLYEVVGLAPTYGDPAADTVYLSTGTFSVAGDNPIGTFTVAADTSGALAVAGTTGALVATGNAIHIDETKLAAVTIYGGDLKTASGLQQSVNLYEVVGLAPRYGDPAMETVYLGAGTFSVASDASIGTFTVGADVSGALAVTSTSGAAVATGNTIHFDETKLAAVTIYGTDLKTADGLQQSLNLNEVVALTPVAATDTVYLGAGTFHASVSNGPDYGTFTVAANASGALAVTGTSGALVATGDIIHFNLCELEQVQITPDPGFAWNIPYTTQGNSYASDVVSLPDGSYSLGIAGPSGFIATTFSVGPSGLSATQLPQDAPLVTLQLVPCQDETTTTVTASVNPSLLNQPVAFTATVSVQDGDVPTGTVQFLADGVNFGAPVPLTNGSASIATAALAAGNHVITAVYGGAGFFQPSSGQLVQAVHYHFGGFLPPLDDDGSYKLGRDLPIKFRLMDYNGSAVTNVSAVRSLQVQAIDAQGQPIGTPFNPAATAGTVLRYDPTSQQFIFNWDTTGLTLGYYRVLLTLDDGTLWTLDLRLK
jgi:hypothetical protein